MASGDDYRNAFGDGRATAARRNAAETKAETPQQQAAPEDASAPPPKQSTMFTRAYDAWGVGEAWLRQLAVNPDSILQREGQHDLKLFSALLDDDVVFSAFQQRQLALVARPWTVEPGDDTPAAKEAADHLRKQIDAVGWDRVCFLMMFARWFGYGVAELVFKIGPDGKYWIDEIVVPDRCWFAFTNAGELRMRTPTNAEGEPVPPNKFWAIRTGATHDFAPYGTGLAHWVYWPVWFKKNVLKFWALFLEKFGMPTTVGLLPMGTDPDDPLVDDVLEAAQAVGRDSAVVVNGITSGANNELKSPLETIEASRSGSGASSYQSFVDTMDEAIMRVVLGQTMTSKAASQGIGSNQSDTQKDVRDEIIAADSDMLHEPFNRGPARWITRWNFGDAVAAPRVYRNMEDAEDLNTVADRDVKLDGIGIKRTEESVTETYGEGYEVQRETPEEKAARELALAQATKPAGAAAAGDGNVVDLADERAKRKREFAASGPRPLYVYRPLINAADVVAWAKRNGIARGVPASEMHVTVLYSKAPVDWFEINGEYGDWGQDSDGRITVKPGGPRTVEAFGDNAIVLRFASADLRYRHDSMIERGATSDFPDYAPHVTITYDGAGLDLDAIEPFDGPLVFGLEVFEEIVSSFTPETTEFSAREEEAIERLASAVAAEGNEAMLAFAAQLQVDLHGVNSAPAMRVALLEAIERLPIERLAAMSALPMLAARAAAAAGLEDRIVA